MNPAPPPPAVPVAPDSPDTRPDAVIFIPGLGARWIDQTADGIGRRLADALALTDDGTDKPTYEIGTDARDEDFLPDFRASVRTIVRKSATGTAPKFVLFTFPYEDHLIRDHEARGVLVKSLVVFWSLIQYIPRFLSGFGRSKKGKSAAEKVQLFIALSVLSLLGIYTLLLLVTALEVLPQPVRALFGGGGGSTDGGTSTTLVQRGIAGVTLLLTIAGLTWSKFTAQLSRAASTYLCAIQYLDSGQRRAELIGKLEHLILHLQQSEPGYRRVHIVAYSFGTILALDTLYPPEQEPRTILKVHTLITIGTGFDLIRTYWPQYFERCAAEPRVACWANVYSPQDVLGSNFRDDTRRAKPEKGLTNKADQGKPIVPDVNLVYQDGAYEKSQGLWGWVGFQGLRVHSKYWSHQYEGEKTCFRLFLPYLTSSPCIRVETNEHAEEQHRDEPKPRVPAVGANGAVVPDEGGGLQERRADPPAVNGHPDGQADEAAGVPAVPPIQAAGDRPPV